MIEAIIFDFDSTLTDYHYSDTKAIFDVVSLLPKSIDRNLFLQRSGEIISQIYDEMMFIGSEVHELRLNRTITEFGLEWNDKYLEKYLSTYLNTVVVYDDVKCVLELLKGKVKIGILTNSTDSVEQRIRIENSESKPYFDEICIAAEIGYYKPDKNAFLYTCNKLQCNPNNTVFIGDSEQYDIIGAKNAGMYTIKKDNKTKRNSIADYRFSSYLDLLGILQYYGIR